METQIKNHFSEMFKEARLLLTMDGNEDVARNLEKTSMKLGVMYDMFTHLTVLMNNLHRECQEKAVEIREEIELKKKYDEKSGDKFAFVFHGKYKNMSWGDIADLEDRRENLIKESEQMETKLVEIPEQIPFKKITVLDGVNLPKEIKVRMVSRLDNLPPAFGWYSGDKNYRAGIYIRLPENMFVRIPFPDVIDGTQNYTRNKTIKCKYETEDQCYESRKFLADRYNTEIRECLFAHKGDVYSKVGNNFRCPVNPRFGNHSHLKTDIENLKADDIKPVLMYSLSDLFSCYLWNDYHHSEDRIIFGNVEECQ